MTGQTILLEPTPNRQEPPPRLRGSEPTAGEYAILAGIILAGYSSARFAALYAHLFPLAGAGMVKAATAAYRLSGADRGRKGGTGGPRRSGTGGGTRTKGPGSAAQRARRAEARFIAVFIHNAATRIDRRVSIDGESFIEAVRKEAANARARAAAARNRARAARVVDAQAVAVGKRTPRGFGPHYDPEMDPATRPDLAPATVDSPEVQDGAPLWLQWQAHLDERTSPECRAADGHVFDARTAPPIIGWPGAVHPHCRCTPGRPTAAGFQAGTVNEAVGHLVSEHRPDALIGG